MSMLSWNKKPGAFELFEQGMLNEDQPQFDQVSISDDKRGWQLSATELKRRWKYLINQLKGYRKGEVIFNNEPIWVPIIELHVPPGGKASLTYIKKSKKGSGLELRILGIGFGSTESISISESIEFDAHQNDKSFQVKMLTSATKYYDANNNQLIRIDLGRPKDDVEYKILDIPPGDNNMEAKDLNLASWRITRVVRLSSSLDSGFHTLKYDIINQAKWKIGIGTTLSEALGIKLEFDAECERSNEFELSFKMPYGHDYTFYRPVGESPISPLCITGIPIGY